MYLTQRREDAKKEGHCVLASFAGKMNHDNSKTPARRKASQDAKKEKSPRLGDFALKFLCLFCNDLTCDGLKTDLLRDCIEQIERFDQGIAVETN